MSARDGYPELIAIAAIAKQAVAALDEIDRLRAELDRIAPIIAEPITEVVPCSHCGNRSPWRPTKPCPVCGDRPKRPEV